MTPNQKEELLTKYVSERSGKELSFSDFVTLILRAVNDFLSERLSTEEFTSLLNDSYFNALTKKYHEKPYLFEHNNFLAWISELSDLKWLEESAHYPDFRLKIQKKLEEFSSYYIK